MGDTKRVDTKSYHFLPFDTILYHWNSQMCRRDLILITRRQLIVTFLFEIVVKLPFVYNSIFLLKSEIIVYSFITSN